MRRSTLGTVNSNQLQMRQSIQGEKKNSLGARSSVGRRVSSGRLSVAGNGKSRRSSQYGKGGYMVVKDPRPLSDRGYQQKMIKQLMEFLTESDYPHPISMRVLSAPPMKEFLKVFLFVFKFVCPSSEVHTVISKKPEEEVPKMLKMIGYPFTISKSSMFSVGSPHTWPSILGALCWLIDLIRFGMTMSVNIDKVLFPAVGDEFQDGPGQEDKLFFDYLEKSYHAFMADGRDLDDLEDYDKEFEMEIRNLNATAFAEIEQLSAQNAELEQELASLENNPSQLETLLHQRSTLKSDREKFTTYISDLEKHKKKLEERKNQLEEELQTMRMELEAANQENIELQSTLNRQELSAGDVERIKKERQELCKIVEVLEKERDYLDQQIWNKEMQFAKEYEQTEKHIREYNDVARRLKLIPISAENSGGIDFEMHFNPHAQRVDQRTSMDFRGTIKPALLRLKQQVSEKTRALQSQIITEEEALDQIRDMVTDKQEEVSTLDSRLSVLDQEYEWKKEVMDKEYKKATAYVQTLKSKLQEMRIKCQTEVDEKETEFKEAQESVEARINEMDLECEEYKKFLTAVCHKCMEHKTLIQNRCLELLHDSEKTLQETRALEVPRSTAQLDLDEESENS